MTTAVDKLSNNAAVILKDTTHPGNIGSAARAMKTCGLQKMILTSPRTLIDNQSRAMAAGAADILDGAITRPALADAIFDCTAVFAYTARRRDLSPPQIHSAKAGELAAGHIRRGEKIALLFGGEQSGLDNDSIRAATYAVEIPTNPHYSSLNLAMAVQIAVYDLRRALITSPGFIPAAHEMPTQQELQNLHQHAAEVITMAKMPRRGKGKLLLTRLSGIINRAAPTASEVRLLRGIFKATAKKLNAEK
ncbi:MAG: RNA methyltransferase [Gammaproteobacteria bacterium]